MIRSAGVSRPHDLEQKGRRSIGWRRLFAPRHRSIALVKVRRDHDLCRSFPAQCAGGVGAPATARSHRLAGASRRLVGVWRLLAPVLLVGWFAGCSWMPFVGGDKDDEEEDVNATEQMLYRNAQRSLRAGNYDRAVTALERLEARFPFGRYAEQAQLELVYARHQSSDHDTARMAADRFIRLHPQHSNIDYAYYLKGLAAYNKNRGLLDRVFTSDASKRDMTSARQAYADFAELLSRHPHSEYAADAKQRMIYLKNLLAAAELHVADYYLRRGAYLAAANRARYVLENYPQAESVPEALIVLVEAQYRLDLPAAANDALRVLAVNYPNYPAFDENGDLVLADRVRDRDRSWANLVTLGLLDRPEAPPPLRLQHPEGFEPPPRAPAAASAASGERKQRKQGRWRRWVPFF